MQCWSCGRMGHVSRFCPDKSTIGSLDTAQQAVVLAYMCSVDMMSSDLLSSEDLSVTEQFGCIANLQAWVSFGSQQLPKGEHHPGSELSGSSWVVQEPEESKPPVQCDAHHPSLKRGGGAPVMGGDRAQCECLERA